MLIPQATDVSYPKLLVAVDEIHVQLYEKANCPILQVEVSDLNTVYKGLCFELARTFIESNRSVFKTISSWGPDDVPFKELAFVFLLADRYSFSFLPLSSADK